MGATLADGGVNPLTGERVVAPAICKRVLAVMATAGLYERSGEWMYDVGLPGKSGVSGGIVTVSPGKGGLGTFSPRLDAAGNSVRGTLLTTHLSERLGLNISRRRGPCRHARPEFPPRLHHPAGPGSPQAAAGEFSGSTAAGDRCIVVAMSIAVAPKQTSAFYAQALPSFVGLSLSGLVIEGIYYLPIDGWMRALPRPRHALRHHLVVHARQVRARRGQESHTVLF